MYSGRYKGSFLRTVARFVAKEQNKTYPVVYSVFFDEDEKFDNFNSGQLKNILHPLGSLAWNIA